MTRMEGSEGGRRSALKPADPDRPFTARKCFAATPAPVVSLFRGSEVEAAGRGRICATQRARLRSWTLPWMSEFRSRPDARRPGSRLHRRRLRNVGRDAPPAHGQGPPQVLQARASVRSPRPLAEPDDESPAEGHINRSPYNRRRHNRRPHDRTSKYPVRQSVARLPRSRICDRHRGTSQQPVARRAPRRPPSADRVACVRPSCSWVRWRLPPWWCLLVTGPRHAAGRNERIHRVAPAGSC